MTTAALVFAMLALAVSAVSARRIRDIERWQDRCQRAGNRPKER